MVAMYIPAHYGSYVGSSSNLSGACSYDLRCTVRRAGFDQTPGATHTTIPPSASLRTPLKVSIVLRPSLTVTISIPVKLVPVVRATSDDDPLEMNRQPTITGDPFSSPMHWKVALLPSKMVES